MQTTIERRGTFTEGDLLRLREELLDTHPFWGVLSYKLRFVPIIENRAVPTLSTNGQEIRFNPEFMASLSHEERLGVVAHELGHNALGHVWRRDERDIKEWNISCDYVLNQLLVDDGFTLPKGVCLDPQYKGMSAEQVYSMRHRQQPEQTPEPEPEPERDEQEPGDEEEQGPGGEGDEGDEQDGGDQPGEQDGDQPGDGEGEGDQPGEGAQQSIMGDCPTGEFTDPPPTSEPGAMTEQDWQIAAEEARRVATAAGTMPGSMGRALLQTREPVLDWRAELREFITHTVPSELSWTHPNRRFISSGLYLPGLMRENTGEIVAVFDVSGSVTQPMLNDAASELTALMRDARPERLVCLFVDTELRGAVLEFSPDDVVELTLPEESGGGTLFQPAFDYLEAEGIRPAALVYFTDLEGPAPEEPPYPVLWITPGYSTEPEPFGRLVRMPY